MPQTLFHQVPLAEAKALLRPATRQAGEDALVKAVETIIKEARWYPYQTKVNSLRIALSQFKRSRRMPA